MKTILLTALLLLGAVGAFAQEKTLSKAEFDSVVKNAKWALDEWKGKPLRMTQTHEAGANGKKNEFAAGKVVIDFASPTVSRSISESTSAPKTESIRIGDKTYKRIGDGAWVEGTVQAKTNAPPPPPPAAMPPAEDQAEKIIEYKYLGTEQLNGLTTNVYVATTKTKRLNPVTNQESLSMTMEKYWLSEEGVKVKMESTGETRSPEINFYRRLTVVWQLDPTIKVEAPAVN